LGEDPSWRFVTDVDPKKVSLFSRPIAQRYVKTMTEHPIRLETAVSSRFRPRYGPRHRDKRVLQAAERLRIQDRGTNWRLSRNDETIAVQVRLCTTMYNVQLMFMFI
jgi:hypothetical protein